MTSEILQSPKESKETLVFLLPEQQMVALIWACHKPNTQSTDTVPERQTN